MKHFHVLDTHPLLWYPGHSPRLGAAAESILQDTSNDLVLPATAYGECCWIVEHGKVAPLKVADLQAAIEADPRIII